MNFVSKVRHFLAYRREVQAHRDDLLKRFNMKVDQIGRLYTVYTIPEKDVAQYGEEFTENAFKNYLNRVDSYLITTGVGDMYGKLEEERLSENQIRVVIGYRFFDAERVANLLVAIMGYLLVGLGVGVGLALLYFFLKLANFL